MKIYFGGSIRGGRDLQELYFNIIEHIKSYGHIVLTEHIANKNLSQQGETNLSDNDIFERDIYLLNESKLMIVDVSIASLGVGYEIAYALENSKKVVCLCNNDSNLSAMIKGNSHKNIVVEFYESFEDIKNILNKYLV